MLTRDSEAGGWGEAEPSSTLRRPNAPSEIVRDDWEDEDEDEQEDIPIEEKNKKIWDKANYTTAPMPAFIVSSSSSASVVPPPPAAAFQPALKILKRPVNNRTSSSSSPSAPKESIEEREARYQAARDRIFGENASSGLVNSEASTVQLSSKNDNNVLRNPRGPDDTDASSSKGFDRRTKTPNAAS